MLTKREGPNSIHKGFKATDQNQCSQSNKVKTLTKQLREARQLSEIKFAEEPNSNNPQDSSIVQHEIIKTKDCDPQSDVRINAQEESEDLMIDEEFTHGDGDDQKQSSGRQVNFFKLTSEDQRSRFQNMQKKIQRLQIRIRSLKINNRILRVKHNSKMDRLTTKSSTLFEIKMDENSRTSQILKDSVNDQSSQSYKEEQEQSLRSELNEKHQRSNEFFNGVSVPSTIPSFFKDAQYQPQQQTMNQLLITTPSQYGLGCHNLLSNQLQSNIDRHIQSMNFLKALQTLNNGITLQPAAYPPQVQSFQSFNLTDLQTSKSLLGNHFKY